MIVEFERHFQIESNEFSHVTMSVGIFGAKYGSDCKDTVEVASNRHLLVELWRLSQVSGSFEVADLNQVH